MSAEGNLQRQPLEEGDHHEVKIPKLNQYFQQMTKMDASDLHLKSGRAPHIRLKAELRRTKAEPLTSEEIKDMAFQLMSEKQRAFFDEHGNIDLAYQVPGGDRFRINVFRQRGLVSVSVRRVSKDIPDFESLHLPAVMEQIAETGQGLVLLSGPSGCGKSTTIAAMLEHINSTRPCHIVTIEDPIEYIYEDKKALVNQREVGIDVATFDLALKYLMREDPDVVLIGEMRDPETFTAALQAAETGHLVFGTAHASSAPQTIERVLALFPIDQRPLMRQSLAFNMRAIVCQRLLPSIREGVDRVPAVEVLLMNPSVRQFIEEEREGELSDVIRSSERQGMRTITKSLLELIEQDFVDPKVAYTNAPNVDELKMMLKGISAGHSGLTGR